ncbi:MAG: hypothetical protein CMF72_15830 [Mameliella sp.]|nr:hypothetical protein [Mameliella sp.]|tara:strand:+ start:9481 stop:10053 length:573 start_codon:yes stop_codon:yes gene_type:complete
MLNKLRTLTLHRRRSLQVTTAIVFVSAAYCFYIATQLPRSILPGYPGDGFFPRITLSVILIFAAIILLRELIRTPLEVVDQVTTAVEADEDDDEDDDKSGPIRFDLLEAATIVVLSTAYVVLMRRVGLEIMTTIFMFCLFFPRILMPWPKAAAYAAVGAVATTIFIYFAFVIGLGVSLPLAFLPRYLGQY